jgi:hypothetical protein
MAGNKPRQYGPPGRVGQGGKGGAELVGWHI